MKTTAATPTRRILMCVSGMSPAVITETLYALVTQQTPFMPDEIHVVTTLDGKQKVLDALLTPITGYFHRLMQEYLPGKTIRFDADTVHVIGQIRQTVATPSGSWLTGLIPSEAPKLEEVQLKDITTNADNQAAADTIYRVMRELKTVPGTVLHASVAGGRKSMSFYMGHSFSLLAETDDTLSHVLVNEPFENPKLNFFYPPLIPVTLQWGTGELHTISTDQAEVKLAELSVLKLGGLMGKDWPVKAHTSFDFAVRLAQAALVVPELRVVLENGIGWLEICGERIELSPQQFTVFALYAMARRNESALPDGPSLSLEDLPQELWETLGEDLNGGRLSVETSNFSPIRSKIRDALVKAIGPVAHHFKIEADDTIKKSKGTSRPIFLNAPAEVIKLVGMNEWWHQLKEVLRSRSAS